MASVEDLIPGFVLEWSLAFKSMVIVVGALLLLFSSIIRPAYPVLWIVPFLLGALVEWLVVATVYTEMSQMENRIDQTKSEIKRTQSDIETTQGEIETAKSDIQSTQREIEEAKSEIEAIQSEIQDTKSEIEEMRDNTFSFISDSQGVGANDSLEDRLSEVEDELGIGTFSSKGLKSRLSDLERTVEEIERNSGSRF